MVSIWAFLHAALSDTREDAGTVFHSVVVFNQQSRHVTNSLHKDDSVMVAGELRFRTYVDKGSGARTRPAMSSRTTSEPH